ncbi:acyltransferase family protein [Chitinimonas naiadis]
MSTPQDAMTTLRDALKGHDNAFGFIRLMLALLVVVDHAFPLGGFGADRMWAWSQGQDSLGGIAVAGFFAISGYLITKSAGSGDWLQFLWRRALRIFPAYWVILLLTGFVVGPALWWFEHGALTGYFTMGVGGPFHYFYGNMWLDIGQYSLHNLFATTTPYGIQINESVFNGSLWTLLYEWRCYMLIGAIAAFGFLRKLPVMICILCLVLYFLMLLQLADPGLTGKLASWLADPHTVRYTFLFMTGGLMAVYADRIPFDDRIGLAACGLFLFCLFTSGYVLVSYPALVYAVLWLAARLPAALKRIGAVNDYSYGVYIYGFPILQLLAYLGMHRHGFVFYTLLSMALSYLCAVVSWHLVEKVALSYKSRGPGLGLAYWWRALGSFGKSGFKV